MNDREKAVTSERRNEGIRHLSGKIMTPRRGKDDAGIPRTSSTLWMKDTICSFERRGTDIQPEDSGRIKTFI